MTHRLFTAVALSATLALAACESSEERAEEFYQTGLTFLEAGDVDRAIVSFRNVFRYDGDHTEARQSLADALYSQGDMQRAYGEYLRLAEQYPDNALVRQKLASMALQGQVWDEAERHGRRALELAPDAAVNRPIRVSLDFRAAALEEDDPRLDALAEEAAFLLAADPTDILSRRIVVTHAFLRGRPRIALEAVNPAIEQFPDDITYYVLKRRALFALQDAEGFEAHLKAMYTQFPENEEVQRSLISFYLQRRDFAGAEAFLRDRAGPDTGAPQGFIPVIQLIERGQGRDAAKAEIQRLLDANAENAYNAAFFKALLASLQFDDGERDKAVADLQALIETLEPSDQTRRIKSTLANMLLRVGNPERALALAEDILEEEGILEEDALSAVALKLRAQLLIEGVKPTEAITDLLRTLDQSPHDAETLLLMGGVYERSSNTTLQGERLAIAVDISNSAPREALLYAKFLVRQGRNDAARSVLTDARNTNPRNVDVLAQVARLALADNDLGVVRGVIADLEGLPDPKAAEVAVALQSALLQQSRADEGLALLQQQARPGDENSDAVLAVIQAQLRNRRVGEARTYLDGLLAKSPKDENLRLINAALYVAEGNPEESERILREMIAENPAQQTAVGQLYVRLRRMGRVEDARVVLNEGLAVTPDSTSLLQYHAGELGAMGEIDTAVAIYEDLYARNPNNVAVANNLASLIANFRNTDEALERAAAVAGPLRGTDIPAFQDTYGWIAYRQGNYAEALEYLQPAAQGLPNDPLVQFNLGMAYLAVDWLEEARTQMERALELAGPDTTLPQMTTALEVLKQLADQ